MAAPARSPAGDDRSRDVDKRIIINSAELETRIALVEGTQLAELQIQGRGEASIVGNIYKARVLRVLPGMQAAFVDLGLEKAGFMHVSDFWSGPGELESVELAPPPEGDLEQELRSEPSLAAYVDEIDAGPEPAISPTEVEIFPTADDFAAAPPDGGVPPLADAAPAGLPRDPGAEDEPSAESEEAHEAAIDGEAAPAASRSGRGRRGSRGGRRRSRRGRGKSSASAARADDDANEAAPLPPGQPDAEDAAEETEPTSARTDDRDPDTIDETPAVVRPPIEDLLAKGQEILVQVSKEPIGSKGARITSHISLPGRYVVYMPTTDHVGVSRRIEDEKERARLRDIVSTGRGQASGGFIVRTACEGLSKREILADMRFLTKLWAGIVKKAASASPPALLHEDLDMVLRAIRDLFTTDVTQVVVDRESDRARVVDFVDSVLQPRLKSRVELCEGPEPIFDRFGIENQVNRALERRVWLKSGGYLVFDQTEALTTIDVNTGRFVGKKTHEETVLKTNLEAAQVALDQLRLRNIGGIIIIDFIDMEKAANRKKVSEALAEAVKRDKARTNILRISELGLVQMTRKRTRDNLGHLVTVACPSCNGEGRLRAIETLAAESLRAARRALAASPEAKALKLRLGAEVARALRGPLAGATREFEERTGVRLEVEADERLGRGHSEIHVPGQEPREKREGRGSGHRRGEGAPRGGAAARNAGSPTPTAES